MPRYLSYRESGVDYASLDRCKRLAQDMARLTATHLRHHQLSEVAGTRGESAYLTTYPGGDLARATEQLGSLMLVADAMAKATGRYEYYKCVGFSSASTALNDVLVNGAIPFSIDMVLQAGDAKWFHDQRRFANLFAGWLEACHVARCVWGSGDTAAVPGIIRHGTANVVASALGRVAHRWRKTRRRLKANDAILLLASSGIHTNGLTLARRIAAKLPRGYRTHLPNGVAFGDALLTPATIYAPLLEKLQDEGVEVHYVSPITGHGWKKIMRAEAHFTYRIRRIPKPQPIFQFLVEQGPIRVREAYATFNMGAGLALYVPQDSIELVQRIARTHNLVVTNAGVVEKGPKQVIIEPLDNLSYTEDDLNIR